MTLDLTDPTDAPAPCECPSCRIRRALGITTFEREFSHDEADEMVRGLVHVLASLMAFMDDDGVHLTVHSLLEARQRWQNDPRIAVQIREPQGRA